MFTTVQDLKPPLDLQSSSVRKQAEKAIWPPGRHVLTSDVAKEIKGKGKPPRSWSQMDWKPQNPALIKEYPPDTG